MSNDEILSFQRINASLRRGKDLILKSIGIALALAITYLLFSDNQYTATSSIMLDPSQAKTVSEISDKATSTFEKAAIESQVEIVKSRRVALKVAEYLSSKEEFKELQKNPIELEEQLQELGRGVSVNRVGETYVLKLDYTAVDPRTAADRANAYAQAYIHDQINSFAEDTSKTSEWLKQKIAGLRQDSIIANLAVQKFRMENNLINSNGVSVNEQQLTNINTTLANAQAQVVSAHAKYLYSQQIIKNKDLLSAVAEAFDNDVINNIRSKYLDDQQRVSQLIRTLGNNHETVTNLKKEIEESESIIFSEMNRISKSYQNEYQVALSNQKALEKSLSSLVSLKVKNDSQQFELEALENAQDTMRDLYNDYLKKYELINQQQSFPVAESRIITEAVPPLSKSHPISVLIIGMALILGSAIGVFLALIRDNFDTSFKRGGQIQNSLGLFFLGFLPRLSKLHAFNARQHSINQGHTKSTSIFTNPIYTYSTDAHSSIHAATCRNILSALEKKLKSQGCCVIGVISDIPTEGKSITATNFALFTANSNKKCLLIDGDIRNPILSLNNFKSEVRGLNHLLFNKVQMEDVVVQDDDTQLYVLPTEHNASSMHSNVESFKKLIESSRILFDYIIIDLPPLSATVDAACYVDMIDYFLPALEWGKSEPNSLKFYLKQHAISQEKIIGVVLSEANMDQMTKHYGHAIYPEYTTV